MFIIALNYKSYYIKRNKDAFSPSENIPEVNNISLSVFLDFCAGEKKIILKLSFNKMNLQMNILKTNG